MARHKSDESSQRQLDEIEQTRTALNTVVEMLTSGVGLTRSEIARGGGWTPGYLTEVLTGRKAPTARKMSALIEEIGPLVVGNTGKVSPDEAAIAEAALGELQTRYGLATGLPAEPYGRIIGASAPNYVSRDDVEAEVEFRLTRPGIRFVSGPPASGVSSLLGRVQALASARGMDTVPLSARDELPIETSQTGFVGALAACLEGAAGSEATLSFAAAHEIIRRRLVDSRHGLVLLIDDVNDLSEEHEVDLKATIRDWDRRAAREEPGFANLHAWLATTSRVRNAKARSALIGAQIRTRWFEPEEVADLASTLAPYRRVVDRAATDADWERDVARRAFDTFAGQPLLTHMYLFDCHVSGVPEDPEAEEPGKLYAEHLNRLAKLAHGLFGPDRAKTLATVGDETFSEDILSQADIEVARSLGLLKPEGEPAWSCSYYEKYLTPRLRSPVFPA